MQRLCKDWRGSQVCDSTTDAVLLKRFLAASPFAADKTTRLRILQVGHTSQAFCQLASSDASGWCGTDWQVSTIGLLRSRQCPRADGRARFVGAGVQLACGRVDNNLPSQTLAAAQRLYAAGLLTAPYVFFTESDHVGPPPRLPPERLFKHPFHVCVSSALVGTATLARARTACTMIERC